MRLGHHKGVADVCLLSDGAILHVDYTGRGDVLGSTGNTKNLFAIRISAVVVHRERGGKGKVAVYSHAAY